MCLSCEDSTTPHCLLFWHAAEHPRWMGFHIIKHYYAMRQYVEASSGVRDFLQFLRSEARLPADFAAALDAAIEVGQAATSWLWHEASWGWAVATSASTASVRVTSPAA